VEIMKGWAGVSDSTTPQTELYLIRHGETDWNVERRVQGHSGPGLNERGRQQARAAAQSLDGTSIAALYTSDLPRAVESARIIGAALGLPARPDPRLRERDQGVWQGMLIDELDDHYPEIHHGVLTDPLNQAPPGGENLAQVGQRMTGVLDEIAAAHSGERVAVVSHGMAIGVVLCLVGSRPMRQVWDLRPENGEVIALRWPPEQESRP
jgi:broad specificity phosphatase PhoE